MASSQIIWMCSPRTRMSSGRHIRSNSASCASMEQAFVDFVNRFFEKGEAAVEYQGIKDDGREVIFPEYAWGPEYPKLIYCWKKVAENIREKAKRIGATKIIFDPLCIEDFPLRQIWKYKFVK